MRRRYLLISIAAAVVGVGGALLGALGDRESSPDADQPARPPAVAPVGTRTHIRTHTGGGGTTGRAVAPVAPALPLIDTPAPAQRTIDIGERRMVDELPIDASTTVINLGELLDADAPDARAPRGPQPAPINIGAVRNADDPLAAGVLEEKRMPITIGAPLDADNPSPYNEKVSPPRNIGPPLDAMASGRQP